MDSSLGLNIFTVLFLSGTFLAALVAGLGGFAFGIVAAAVWLYILTPLQTATLIMCLGLVVQGYSVWKLRHALHWQRLAPLIVGAALGVPLGVFTLAHADPLSLPQSDPHIPMVESTEHGPHFDAPVALNGPSDQGELDTQTRN
jgi:uncharacterized membrane protein YfcA